MPELLHLRGRAIDRDADGLPQLLDLPGLGGRHLLAVHLCTGEFGDGGDGFGGVHLLIHLKKMF